MLERFFVYAAYVLPSVLVFFPLTYYFFNRTSKTSFTNTRVAMSFGITWLICLTPGFLFGPRFNNAFPMGMLLMPIMTTVIVVSVLRGADVAPQTKATLGGIPESRQDVLRSAPKVKSAPTHLAKSPGVILRWTALGAGLLSSNFWQWTGLVAALLFTSGTAMVALLELSRNGNFPAFMIFVVSGGLTAGILYVIVRKVSHLLPDDKKWVLVVTCVALGGIAAISIVQRMLQPRTHTRYQ